jgi:hypothetical protein
MSCQNCAGLVLPQCGDDPLLICVRRESDALTIPAWVTAVCAGEVITGFALFADSEVTIPLPGFTIADRIPCPENLVGTGCDSAASTNLCPATIDQLQTISETQTAALQGTMESVGEEIEAAVREQTPFLQDYDSVGAVLPADFHSLPQALAYNIDDNVETITVTDGVDTWVKTFTYTGLNVTGISGWEVQP